MISVSDIIRSSEWKGDKNYEKTETDRINPNN